MSDRRDLGIDTHRAEELVVGRDVLEGGAPQEAGEADVPHLAALEGEPNTARPDTVRDHSVIRSVIQFAHE